MLLQQQLLWPVVQLPQLPWRVSSSRREPFALLARHTIVSLTHPDQRAGYEVVLVSGRRV